MHCINYLDSDHLFIVGNLVGKIFLFSYMEKGGHSISLLYLWLAWVLHYLIMHVLYYSILRKTHTTILIRGKRASG